MKKKYSHIIWPGLILFFVAAFFYFDKTMIIGMDNSFYLDLSALISRGNKFLIDFFDYRVPIFPLLFSPIYKMGFADFTNRFFMLFSIYSLYGLALYFISLSLTRSPWKSFLAVLLVFVSISSRQFDPGRDGAVPLFYHTLELISLFLLFTAILVNQTEPSPKKILFYSFFSGILWAMAFIGRPVHLALPLVVSGFTIYWLYKKWQGKANRNGWLIPVGFLAGLGISALSTLWIFYVPDADYLTLLKKWLLEIPPVIYRTEPWRIIKKFVTTFYWGLPAIRNIFLPLYWTTYLVSAAGMAVFFFSESAENIGLKIRSFYQKNKALPLFVLLAGFMAVTTVLLTGSGAKSHESPFFTLYFFILVLVLSNAKLSQHLKNWEIYIFIAAFLLPQSVDFAKKELKIYLIDRTNQTDAYLPEKVAAELKKVTEAEDPVLILGAYPAVTRLVDYRPFMGQTNGTFLYSGSRFFGENYQKNLVQEMEKVNVAYKLFDYPNSTLKVASGIREDRSNPIYLYIEKYLKDKFIIAAAMENSQLQKVTVYRRKLK